MKGKYYLGAFFMALLGAFIALLAYTKVIDTKTTSHKDDTTVTSSDLARPLLTTYQQAGPGQVDLTYAAQQTVHAVVHVMTSTTVSGRTNNPIMEWFYGDQSSRAPRELKGYGSGVIITSDGYIITNNHVVDDAQKVSVTLNDNRVFDAKVIGQDPSTDIALLKINAENLPFIKYGDSDALKLGEWVLAVGNPFNLTSTVTAGIVSAKGRNLGILDDNYRIESFIQTDAALNVGNSGGALVNTSGLLVGITSAILSPSGAYAGNSFAIPVNIVKKVVEDLKQYGEVQRAIIGVNIQEVTPEIAQKEDLKAIKGAYIAGVNSKGAADQAGLKEKDVIVALNGVPGSTVSELQEQIGQFRPGDKTNITFIRDGKTKTVPITMRNIDNSTGIVKPGEGEGGSEVFGARLENLTPSDKDQYNLDYGVKVATLNDGRFKDLGIQKGYIIMSVNGKKVQNASDVRNFTNNGKDLTSIEGIQSNGTYFSYQFRR